MKGERHGKSYYQRHTRICGVGISTVSRAINDDPGINQNTRKRILKVIKEYNYVPNNSARNLKMTESNTMHC